MYNFNEWKKYIILHLNNFILLHKRRNLTVYTPLVKSIKEQCLDLNGNITSNSKYIKFQLLIRQLRFKAGYISH